VQRATFFEIGEHATWHPEITKQVIEAGMTVGTHTWSHKDLARNPYAQDVELAKREIEMGVSAVHMAAGGGKVAPFFRFPDLQHPPQLMSYLAERNIAVFSTDIDSRDFKMHKPEEVIKFANLNVGMLHIIPRYRSLGSRAQWTVRARSSYTSLGDGLVLRRNRCGIGLKIGEYLRWMKLRPCGC
jgi:peptidoglycan/xylan/chitin deacetylase (PgdA/CDA1 family)